MDRALLALSALILNAALGGPRRWYEKTSLTRWLRAPVKFLRDIERRLNREQRSLKEREARGLMLLVAVLLVCLFAGWLGELIFYRNLQFLEILVVALLLPVRPIWDIAAGIKNSLAAGSITSARSLLEGTAWRHHALLDEHGLARAAIETIAVGFSEKIVGAVFWYLIFGLPGLFIAVAVTMMREHMAQPIGVEQGFGRATWELHTLLHYIPSRLAALLWLGVSLFLPSGRWRQAWQVFMGAALSAPPHALALLMTGTVVGVLLGGPSSIYVNHSWIGAGTARATIGDMQRALTLFALLHLLLFILLGLVL